MELRSVFLIGTITMLLVACTYKKDQAQADDTAYDYPISAELAGVLASEFDINGDNKPDVFYDYEAEYLPGYFELIDRNFDGRIDETTFFSADNGADYGRADNNYDGFMDTVVFYEYKFIKTQWIDRNNNHIVDTVVNFEYGEPANSIRYYPDGGENGGASIGTVTYNFSYPSEETLEDTTLSEEDFQTMAKPIVPIWSNKYHTELLQR